MINPSVSLDVNCLTKSGNQYISVGHFLNGYDMFAPELLQWAVVQLLPLGGAISFFYRQHLIRGIKNCRLPWIFLMMTLDDNDILRRSDDRLRKDEI